MRGKIEKYYPIVMGSVAAVLFYFTVNNAKLPNSIHNIFSAAANLSAIAIGFLGAAMAIVLAITNSRVIKSLKQTGAYVRLINYFDSAIKASFCLAVLSFFGLLVDTTSVGLLQTMFATVYVFFLIVSGAKVYRVIDVFSHILRNTQD